MILKITPILTPDRARTFARCGAALVAANLAACGPFDEVPEAPRPDAGSPSGSDAASTDLVDAQTTDGGARPDGGSDPGPAPAYDQRPLHTAEAPGADWYAYDGRTRAVTPDPVRWIARSETDVWAVQIENYYDDRGRSGFFTWRAARWDGVAWNLGASVRTERNVKEASACVDLTSTALVSCDDDAWDLALLTLPRALPTPGFTVRDPALLFPAHHNDADASFEVLAVSDPIDDLPHPDTFDLGSARVIGRLDPTATPVDGLLDAVAAGFEVQQITTDLQHARWTASVDGDTVSLASACAQAAQTPAAQTPTVPTDAASEAGLRFVVPEGHQVLVDLCGEAAPATLDRGRPTPWLLPPTDPAWDLVVEHFDGVLYFQTTSGSTARLAPAGAPVLPALWDDV